MHSLELVNTKLLIDKPNLEVDRIRGRQIDLDLVDVQPDKQPLHLDTLQLGDGSVANPSGYGLLVADAVVEFDFAGLGQVDDESAVVREGEFGDGVRQEAAWEAVLGEEFVDGGDRIRVGFEEGEGRRGEEGEREEEEEAVEGHSSVGGWRRRRERDF